MIFHRLNTGAVKLNNQEIRNCIFGGLLNSLLNELNKDPSWMSINGMKRSSGYRYTKQELILRFLAFHDQYRKYNGRLASFLNDYMSDNRNPSAAELEQKKTLFIKTVKLVSRSVFEGKSSLKLPVSVLEAILVGVSLNLGYLESQSNQNIQAMYKRLLSEEEFSEKLLKEGLAGKPRVIGRMSTAERIFSGN
jgi:hypothetical protein